MNAIQVIEPDITKARASQPIKETVRRAQEGDSEAFESLYREHYRRIYVLCLRMAGDEDRAEELTQEAFVRAWKNLRSFRGQSRFSTWLHRLTVNVVLRHLRTHGRRAAREETREDLSGYTTAVRRAMPETRIDLERAIAQLPPGARDVLVLHDIEGYRYREIATLMGTAEGTVKSQLHRARRLMREALER